MFKRANEKIVKAGLFLCSTVAIFAVFLIVYQLFSDGKDAIIYWFMNGFGYSWTKEFGIIPLMFSTLYISIGGTLLAFMLGFPTAVYLSEYADFEVRNRIKSSLEVLVGVPSVVMGIFGLALVGTMVYITFNAVICVLTGWIVLSLMVLPYIATVSEDAMRAVPVEYREASLALGASRWQTTYKVVIPNASSGIIASTILALARAVGETIAMALVVGHAEVTKDLITLNPFRISNTLTVFISTKIGESTGTGLAYSAYWGIGVISFVLVAITNTIANSLLRKKK